MSSTPYQLCTKSNHDCFVYFDNGLPGNDRFCVKVSIRKLPPMENSSVIQQVIERHGEGAVRRRLDSSSKLSDVRLEYMKFIVVHHLGTMTTYDIDQLAEVDIASHKQFFRSNSTFKRQLPHTSDSTTLLYGFVMHRGEQANRSAKLVFPTKSHGNVTLTLSTYADPDIRNGLDIDVEKNLSKSTCWGGLVIAINPRLLRVKKMHQLPPSMTPQAIARRNDSNFWLEKDGFVERKGEMVATKLRVPRTTRDTAATQLLTQ
mgnify:CR=1 FL=1